MDAIDLTINNTGKTFVQMLEGHCLIVSVSKDGWHYIYTLNIKNHSVLF